MLTRELAEKVLKELAVSMYEYCINDLKLNQEQATKLVQKEIKDLSLKREKEKEQLLEASKLRDDKKQESELLKDELSNLLSKDLLQVVEEIERPEGRVGLTLQLVKPS